MSHANENEIRKQALDWLVWVDAGHACTERQKEFEAWLCADERHREVYLSLERYWRLADGLAQLISPSDRRADPGAAPRN